MLPLGVIIPTRNSAPMLPGHLAALRQWIDSAQQVVVVDSFSTDGTLEMLKSGLSHPNISFLSHPPGLYQSWNFGLQQLKTKYAYLATVGDAITRAGLEHLLDTAERFESDLVLSPPRFLSTSGTVLEGKLWTLHRYLEAQRISLPAAIPRAHLFLTSVLAGTSGMMGSSASNLYRTEVIQARPFPTSFGHIGDTAWGVAHALHVRTAVTPEACASFVIHPGAGNFSREREDELGAGLLILARDSLRQALQSGTVPPNADALRAIFDRYESLHQLSRQADQLYYGFRARSFPWFLRPAAWKARRARNGHRADLKALWLRALADHQF